MSTAPLTRAHEGRVLAGVAAGLGNHLGVPVSTVRIGFAVASLFAGAGALLYLWLWATVPWQDRAPAPLRDALTRPEHDTTFAPREADEGSDDVALTRSGKSFGRGWPVAELALGAGLLCAGAALVLAQFGVELRLELILPGLAVLIGIGLAWWQIADRKRPDRNTIPRVLAALALVTVGVLMFFVTAREPNVWTVIAAAFAVLIGVALAIAPWLLRMSRDLVEERSARAREAERSDIAAHLHDSVLQTLALIQQRAEPGSDIARIARAQERELREWLFRAADGPAAEATVSIEQQLRDHAASLEEAHGVRFELISVGTSRTGDAEAVTAVPEALAAAAREAMLNAAKHAGGNVTVYVEIARDRASVDILDRGPGIDLEALGEGRMGVRESIIGRLQRAGGTAHIGPGPGGAGTSVRLSMPLTAPTSEGRESERAHNSNGERIP